MRGRLERRLLRSIDEKTGEIILTHVRDIWESGTKPVFRVTLENGYALTMSRDHRCLTERGWLTLEQATGVRVGPTHTVTWDGDAPAIAVNGRPVYHDPEWLRARRSEGLNLDQIAERAGTSRHNVRRCLKLYGLSYTMAEISLCRLCHKRVHANHLELELLSLVQESRPISGFFDGSAKLPQPHQKKCRRTTRLIRTYSKIAGIEYAGEQMTYDLEVEGPFHNFVANGFVVHNSVNEYSGRYSLMPMLFYTPLRDQLQTQSRSNNQGRSGDSVPDATYREALRRWESIRSESRSTYEWLTGEDVARELARIDLPLSTFTQWYWKIDLHNLLHFLRLRVDRHAQWEIQEYGRVIAGMLKRAAPLSYEAWIDFDVCGARLSRAELDALRRLVAHKGEGLEAKEGAALDAKDLDALGLSKREARELFDKLADSAAPDFELDLSRARPAEWFAARFADAVPQVDKAPTE